MSSSRRSNRRQFLQGRSAAIALEDAAAAVGQQVDLADPAAPLAAETYLLQYGRPAMACRFEVFLNAGQYADGPAAALAALDKIESLEEQLSVYRETSEIMAINRQAAARELPLEPRLFELLDLCARLNQETGGALDVTTGPLTKVWGFFERRGAVPTAAALDEALAKVGTRHVRLDAERKTIRFEREGIEINLGAIGKGYALDRCAESMRASGVCDFLWHGGRSSVLAAGSRSGIGQDQAGWLVGIGDPRHPGSRIAEIRLRDRAMATSGSRVQSFRHEGRRFGHILDPRTGWPAEGTLSATAVAPSAALADALSTAFYVLGIEATARYCEEHADAGAALLEHGASGRPAKLHAFGLENDLVVV